YGEYSGLGSPFLTFRILSCTAPLMLVKGPSIIPSMPKSNHSTSSAFAASPFYAALEQALDQRGRKIEDICAPHDEVARRVLHDYGAMFVAGQPATPPPVCMFTDENAVLRFQKAAGRAAATIGDAVIELQPA